MTVLGACVLLCSINAADFFSIESLSSFKESYLLLAKMETLFKVPEDEHLKVVYDYCLKNGKFPNKAYPHNRLDAPAFAGEFNNRDSALLATEENMVRDRLARRYKFNNIFFMENSEEMARIARFIAYSLACFPAGSFTYNSTRNAEMDRLYYMYRFPSRYGLKKQHEGQNLLTIKITVFEDYSMYNPTKPVPGHFVVVNHTKFVADNFMMKKRLIAMYLNGVFNFTENPHIDGFEWDADNGAVINKTVITNSAGSHLVGYAFNGFNAGTVIVDKSPYVVLRSQFIAVHAYVYWLYTYYDTHQTDFVPTEIIGAEIDAMFVASNYPYDTCSADSCSTYTTDYHSESGDFAKKGGLKKVDCDVNFKHLCRIYYVNTYGPPPDYKDYVQPGSFGGVLLPILVPDLDKIPELGGFPYGEKCCFLCEITVIACLLLSAAASISFYFSLMENDVYNRAVEKLRSRDIADSNIDVKVEMDSGKESKRETDDSEERILQETDDSEERKIQETDDSEERIIQETDDSEERKIQETDASEERILPQSLQ